MDYPVPSYRGTVEHQKHSNPCRDAVDLRADYLFTTSRPEVG